jgi:hypothetical protein
VQDFKSGKERIGVIGGKARGKETTKKSKK